MMTTLAEEFVFLPKSGRSASSGASTGAFPFFTSSQDLTKWTDTSDYYGPALVFGTGGAASLHYAEGPFSASNDCYVVVPSSGDADDAKFFFYYLRKNIHLVESGFRGAGLKHVSKRHLEQIELPADPTIDRSRIVKLVELAEGVRTRRDLQSALLQQLAKSAFLHTFGDPILNERDFPLLSLADISARITDGEHQNPTFVAEGMPIVMAKQVRFDGVTFDDCKFVSWSDGNRFRRKCGPDFGDILIVGRGATIGRCCIVESAAEFCLMGSVILIKPRPDRVLPEYLHTLLTLAGVQERLITTSSSSAQQAIYLSHLKKMRLPIAPLDLQERFRTLLSSAKPVKEQFRRLASTECELAPSLLQHGLRGRLDAMV